MKKVLYIDMDGVIVDFESGIESLGLKEKNEYLGKYQKCPNIFSKMKPIEGALNAVEKLSEKYDVYILSSPGWGNASAWSDKYNWIANYLPIMKKKLILSSQKHLNKGDYLIDDMFTNGADKFEGKHILFGGEKYSNWDSVLKYFL